MKDLVMTIKTSTGSSKSELSSRGKRPFKVFGLWPFFSTDGSTVTAPLRSSNRANGAGRRRRRRAPSAFKAKTERPRGNPAAPDSAAPG